MFLGSFNRSFLIYLFLLIPGAHDWLFYFAPHSTTTSSPVKITLPRCAEACFLADVKDGGGGGNVRAGRREEKKEDSGGELVEFFKATDRTVPMSF